MAHGDKPPNLPLMHDPGDLAARSARELARRIGTDHHDVLIVLGSGLTGVAEELGAGEESLPLDTLPSFPPYTAGGHRAHGWSLPVEGRQVLVFGGRCHLYEGVDPAEAVHPLRTGIAAGCATVILTAAVGGIRPDLTTGSLMVVEDHLNLSGRTPLSGPVHVDMVDAYSPRLRTIAKQIDPTMPEGVYAGLPGPQYETPAEIRALRTLGADLVGMSTVHETIAARAAGVEVLGLSLVSNLAAGMTGQPLSHEEVIETGRRAATRMGSLLAEFIAKIP